MKRFAFFTVAFFLMFFAACSSNEFLVLNSSEKRAPLDSLTQVRFIYGPKIPVIPENTELVGVMNTNVNTDCNVDGAVKTLEKTARELGADIVFVKKYEEVYVNRGVYAGGLYVSHTELCPVLTADLLATK